MAGILERAGRFAGTLLAPITASVSAARRARMFHPSGIVVRASVRAIDSDPIGEALAGDAIVRLSSAWWKRREWRDVLGIAIRFVERDAPSDAAPRARDQDLLLATIRRPWTMALAPLTTDHTDFLANDYFAVSPFSAFHHPVPLELRAVPARTVREGADRRERLAHAIARHDAVLVLEVRRYRRVWDAETHPWRPIARIELREIVTVDQDALRFDPFRSGRGLEPTGAIHAIRIATYTASQHARPRSAQRRRAAAQTQHAR